MNIVLFKSGLKSDYQALVTAKTTDPNTLYFVTDSAGDIRGEFYKGDVFLGTGKLATTQYDGLVRLTNSITGSETTSDLVAVTPYAVMEYVNSQLAAADAMIYAGSLTVANNTIIIHTHNPKLDFGVTVTDDTTLFSAISNYSAGWTFKVASSDGSTVTGFDKKLEAGDMLIATADIDTTTEPAIWSASDWTVIQTNIDGAVTGPASAVDTDIAVFDGTTGKVIKDGGIKISDITDKYISGAAFADDSTNNASNPVKMTLTRTDTTPTGTSTTTSVTANLPKVSSSSAGVVPKGAEVSTQTQETKFLREDGTWATPSYEVDTDTVRAIKVNGVEKLSTLPSSGAVDFVNSTGNSVNDLEVEFDATGSTIKYKHSNTVTAGTAGSSSDHSQTGTAGGDVTFSVPYVTYDAHGHITVTGTHTETITLPAHQTIKQDGITGATANRYGTCSTSASTAAKVASGFTGTLSLEAGLTIRVEFTYANTASNPTLSVDGGTTNKTIKVMGETITTDNTKELIKGICEFVYDGTAWNLMAELPMWGSFN